MQSRKFPTVAFSLLLIIFSPLALAEPPGGFGGPPPGIKPPPATATVAVDCAAGESINLALLNSAVELTVEISGMCTEDVNITRSFVNLVGTDPALDGLSPGPVELPDDAAALTVAGSNNILIENLTLSGGQFGLRINNSFNVTINNSAVEENVFGIIVSSSGSISATSLTVTTTITGARGMWISNGSDLFCTNCTVNNYFGGIRISQGSEVALIGNGSIQASSRAVQVFSGSRLFSTATGPFSGLGGSRRSLELDANSSATVNGGSLEGRLDLKKKSIVSLGGTSHTLSSSFNRISGDSSVIIDGLSSIQGNVSVEEFSKLVLSSGGTIDGNLECISGGDASCAVPGDVSDGSNCGQCQP